MSRFGERVVFGAPVDDWITAGLVASPFALLVGVWLSVATWWPAPVILGIATVAQGLGKVLVVRLLVDGRI